MFMRKSCCYLELHPIAVAFFALTFSNFACADVSQSAPSDAEMISIRHWYGMSAMEAAKRPEVKISGIVTSVGYGIIAQDERHLARMSLVVSDDSGGIWVRCHYAISQGMIDENATDWSQIRQGTMVEVDGLLEQGVVAPVVLPRHIKVTGQAVLPPAEKPDLVQFFSGGCGMRRVVVSGVVQGMAREIRQYSPFENWLLRVETGVGHFVTRLPIEPQYSVERLLDAEVEVEGIAASSQNWHSQFLNPRIILDSPDDLRVVVATNEDPFDLPMTPLDEIDGFSLEGRHQHRVRVQGTVTYQRNSSMYLQDGDFAIPVKLNPVATRNVGVGDHVEVCGFVDTETYARGLRGAIARHLPGPAISIIPVETTLSKILGTKSEYRAWARRSTNYLENRLVKIQGTLRESYSENDNVPSHVVLDVGTGSISAYLSSNFPDLELGTQLELTGVANVSYAASDTLAILTEPVRVDLLMRSPSDIKVLKYPPWWNARRFGLALLLSLLASLLASVWVVSLQKQLKKQTKEIAVQMRGRRNAVIEYEATLRERNRLAINLHDTVLQTVVGIGYQIDACVRARASNSVAVDEHLSTARRMATRGQEDLRNTVWTMHNVPIACESFSESIEQLLARFDTQTDAKFVVSCAEKLPKIAGFVVGELLLVIQEAVQNSIRHGSPSEILLKVEFDNVQQEVIASVVDDGDGFEINEIESVKDGHFGIDGMIQRIDRLNGQAIFDSRLGEGTTVTFRVPIQNFDSELE